jgi:predicted transcriptional regulator
MQEGLDKKSNNTSSFLQGIASIYENLTWSNTKKYQQRIVQENLEREKTNKSHAINTSDMGDLFYRGWVHEEPNSCWEDH